MHILVVGAGSIGQRHIKNLVTLGVERISIIEPNFDKGYSALGISANVRRYPNVESLVKLDDSPDAVIIAVPTDRHMEVAVELAQHNIPLFIEKPVANILNDALFLQGELEQWAVVGYSLRFHPAFQLIKELLPQVGVPLCARAEVGQYLPDWHPTEDYTKWYMAHEEQGGGALLDLSHEIDYMRWLFGDLDSHTGVVEQISDLQITSDDLAEFTCYFGDMNKGFTVGSIHMDLLDRSYNRRVRIVGSEDTLLWDASNPVVRLLKAEQTYKYDPDRNIQFVEEMRAFVESVQSGVLHPTLCTLDEGIKTLNVVLDLKEQNQR